MKELGATEFILMGWILGIVTHQIIYLIATSRRR